LACFKKPTSRLFMSIVLSQKVFYAYSAIVDSFMIVSFFLEKDYVPQYYRWYHPTFVPHYVNVLVRVVAIFGVINSVPITKPAPSVFCCSAVAHILTSTVNLDVGFKSGFKNRCRAPAVFGLGSGFKMSPFYNSAWVRMQGATRGDRKNTSSTHQQ